MLEKYKAVFFDVGGTLLKPYPSVGDIYAQHAGAFGFRGSAEELNHQFRAEWKKMGGMESLGGCDPHVERRFWYDIVFNVFSPFGGLRNFDVYFEIVYHAFTLKDSWRVFEDVLESGVLDTLKQKGVVMGVVSNWDSRLPLILENMGLGGYFKFILASTVAGSAKPDRKIFDEALRQSNVDAQDACHIGDELNADYHGASRIGIKCILIDRHGRHTSPEVSRISSFLELI